MATMGTSPVSGKHLPPGSSPRTGSPRRTIRSLWLIAVGSAVLLLAVVSLRRPDDLLWAANDLAASNAGAAGGCGGRGGSGGGQQCPIDWGHPLFSQIGRDLAPYEQSRIGLRDIEQAYCQATRSSMRIQVVNGSVYVVGETPSYESRLLNLKRQLLQLWLAGSLPEGIDFVIEHDDFPSEGLRPGEDCPIKGPVLSLNKHDGSPDQHHVLLAPDHTFGGWLEAHTLSWGEMLPLLQQSAERHRWANRSSLMFFRGAATGDRNFTDPKLSEAYPDRLDIQLVNWTSAESASDFISLAQHCRYKMLLHLPGNAYAARLKYLLACGSAVVMPRSPWREFWYHLLYQGQHIIMTETLTLDNKGHQFADVALELQQDDGLARKIGQQGAALVRESLSPAMVQAYWQLLLQRYHALQDYNATVHPDAVPLEQSILIPQVVNVTQRTCLVCKPTAIQLEEQKAADLGMTKEEYEAAQAAAREAEEAAKRAAEEAANTGGGGAAPKVEEAKHREGVAAGGAPQAGDADRFEGAGNGAGAGAEGGGATVTSKHAALF